MIKNPAARFLLFLLVGISVTLKVEASTAVYKLRSSALVHGPHVTAADLLEPVPKGELGKLKLGRLGKPGSERVYTRDAVQQKINRLMRGVAPVVSGERCVVKASVRNLAGKDLLEFGRDYLKQRLEVISADAKVSITVAKPPSDRKVPDRTTRLEIRPPLNERYRGTVVLQLVATQSGDEGEEYEVVSIPVTYRVKVEEQQLVAARPIRRGEILGADNTTLVWKNTTRQRENGFSDLSEVEGYKARQRIAQDRVLTRSVVALPPLIKKGEEIWLIVQSRGIKLETRATALQDGQKDDMILVEVQQGSGRNAKKKIRARVVDAGLVIKLAR